jgi:peptide/nickel transport system permease protein
MEMDVSMSFSGAAPEARPPGQRWMMRVARQILILFGAAVLAFGLVKVSPIDPVDAYLGSNVVRVGPEQRSQIAAHWGFDQPAPVQFAKWATNLLSGDLGRSSMYNEPVAKVIADRVGASIALTGTAWVLSGLIGFTLGVLAGSTRGSWLDRMISIYAYVLASTPTFWLGIVLIITFSVYLRWTPICCAAPVGMLPEEVALSDRLVHLILPVVALSVLGVAQTVMHTRTKIMEVLNSDFVLYARAQGAGWWDVVWHHAVRNAALPALVIQFTLIGELFGGSILAEQVFTYPGLGKATVEAGLRGDIPLMLAISIGAVAVVSLGNSIADGLALWLDPRLRPSRSNP